MKKRPNIRLELSPGERKALRKQKIRISELPDFATDEIQILLEVSPKRARELRALSDFQRIPTVGIAFARDLFQMGFDSLAALKGRDGALLTDAFERMKGYRTDPCVEDQFRLAAYTATTGDFSKRWWDFTPERKAYRKAIGYPADRPVRSWHEMLE